MNMKFSRMLLLTLLTLPIFMFAKPPKKTADFYQITVYHFTTGEQQQVIEQYLKDAYLPALHKQQIKNIGVFMPINNDTSADKRLFVIVPIKSLQHAIDITDNLSKDNNYQNNGKTYIDAAFKNAPYNRMEKILLTAFPLAPFMNVPKLTGPKAERFYELRSYESATEKIAENKKQMFNEGGEIALFKRLNFNAVFYASVVAGSKMPNLMYMTSFENKVERDAHWKSFGGDPEWKKLSALPQYQNNVSKNESIFMHAAEYSDY